MAAAVALLKQRLNMGRLQNGVDVNIFQGKEEAVNSVQKNTRGKFLDIHGLLPKAERKN